MDSGNGRSVCVEEERLLRLIVGISGASGVVMGYYMLKALRSVPDMEIHLIITDGAKKTFPLETEVSIH